MGLAGVGRHSHGRLGFSSADDLADYGLLSRPSSRPSTRPSSFLNIAMAEAETATTTAAATTGTVDGATANAGRATTTAGAGAGAESPGRVWGSSSSLSYVFVGLDDAE
jgi:hypothetical protein